MLSTIYTRWQLVCAFGIGLGLVACSASLEAPALQAYVQDPAHGLVQQASVAGAEVVCAYRPTEILVAQEVAHQPATPTLLDSARRQYAGKSYFSLSLSQGGAEIENQFITDPTAYANALAYLNNSIAADVFLVTSQQDSVQAFASVYPRLYGTTGRSTVLLIFDTRQLVLNEDFHLTLRDTHFGLGTLRFPFKAADLKAVPSLRLP